MKVYYLLLSLLEIFRERVLPISGHCCHPCLHQDFTMVDNDLKSNPEKSCSIGCSGTLSNDGTCAAGSDQV